MILPNALNTVCIEDTIVTDDIEILSLRLRNEHPVKRIAMLSWKFAGPDGVIK